MKVLRAALVQHLEKITCGGQITEAVFSDAFGTRALTPDQLLLVVAPPLPDVEPLEEEVGIADLAMVTRALGFIAGDGNESTDVNIRIEDHRLVIDEEYRGVQKLMTASPKTIGTRIEDANFDKLMSNAPEEKGIPLTQALIDGIKNTFAGYKATAVELTVGPKGGKVRVGSENGHYAEFPSKQLKAKTGYTLLFAKHLVDVLAQVTDFGTAELRLGGPGKFILIKSGEYQYLLSPKKRAAEEKKDESEETNE